MIEDLKNECNEMQVELKAKQALSWIIESNGGLTPTQITALTELIEGGFIEALDGCCLIIHN